MKAYCVFAAAALAVAVPPAAPAQTAADPQVQTIAASQVPAASRRLGYEADLLGREGAVLLDTLSIVRVRGWHGRIGPVTQRNVGDALAKVQVDPGSRTAYSNAPPPGTLADWLGRHGYTTGDVVGLQVRHNGPVVVYVVKR